MPVFPTGYTAIDALAAADQLIVADASAANQTKRATAQQIAAFTASGRPGILYVVSSGGSDANDGRSWSTPKATLQGAVNALPTTPAANSGGVIICSEGDIPTDQSNTGCLVTIPKVFFKGGAGPKPSRIALSSTHQYGIKFDGTATGYSFGGVADLGFQSLSTATAHKGLVIDTAKALHFRNLIFQQFGFTQAVNVDLAIDAAPTAIYVTGIQGGTISDWTEFNQIHIWQSYRGFSINKASNGHVIGANIRDTGHSAIYVHQAGWWFTNIYMMLKAAQNENYAVRLTSDVSAFPARPGSTFLGCETEIVNGEGNVNWGHHFWMDSAHNIVEDHKYIGGAADAGGVGAVHAVRFGENGDNNIIGPYIRNSQGGGIPQFVQVAGATGNVVWQPSDYTGSITTV